jgi:hypothetical protein
MRGTALPALLDQLRQRRDAARESAEQILTRAADDGRDLTADELAEHRQHVVAEREAADEADRIRDEQIAELRAGVARNGRPVLSRASQDLARQFRSAIFARNPADIEVYTDLTDEWPADAPEPVQGRTGQVKGLFAAEGGQGVTGWARRG